MKRRTPFVVLLLVAVFFLTGLYWLFNLRIAGGDLYPQYSTFRADPLGTRGLYEALASLPGLKVERSLKPLEKLDPRLPRTIVLAGIRRRSWESLPVASSNVLDAAVRAGSRVVVLLRAEDALGEEDQQEEKIDAPKDSKPKETDKTRAGGRRAKVVDGKPVVTDWTRLWGAAIKRRLILDGDEGAVWAGEKEGWPSSVPWKSDLYFEPAKGSDWKVVYRRGGSPVLIEMVREKGSVVMASDSYFASNEALQKSCEPVLLAWLVGPHARVVFDESHLGLEEDRGVVGLARHYGLAGCLLLFVLLALLYVWQRAALFVPPAPEETELQLSYNQTVGLEALLRRVLSPSQLMPTCAKEWAKTARPSAVAKLEELLCAQPAKTPAVDQYNAAVRAFRRR